MQELLTYLKAIQNIKESDKEHSYRGELKNFLESIKAKLSKTNKALESIHIHHEPNNDKEGRGAPDFEVSNTSLNIGYIENKRINANLEKVAQSSQIQKYLKLSQNIMLTDYLRFVIVGSDDNASAIAGGGGVAQSSKPHIIRELRICKSSRIQETIKFLEKQNKSTNTPQKALFTQQDLDKSHEILEFFTLFFTHNPKPIHTALEFANALALRTQILRDKLLNNHKHGHIQSVFHTFKKTLYKELEFLDFADSFAQTLTYSLFLAKLNNEENKEIDIYNVKKFIPKSFSLIRSMSGFLDRLDELDSEKNLDSIKRLVCEIIYIINRIGIAEIIKELNKISHKNVLGEYYHKDPYLHFYETFLSQYDPRLREIRGVYYTPAPVVSFIINAIDLILQKDFGKEGLKSALDSEITLLDFATGTGTFLLEAFRKALESIPKDTNQVGLKEQRQSLLQKFHGFEFLISPYVIAHLKISQVLKKEFNITLNDKEGLSIALTNTLYYNSEKNELNKHGNILEGGIPELVEEYKKAQRIKEQNILIITGNPPYSGASSNKGLYEDEVRITYGLEPSLSELTEKESENIQSYFENKSKENAKTFKTILDRKKLRNEKNPKWLLDDYVKFINFAESKIKKQESGIFAFISNNSFLDNPTFRGMRYSLLKTFDMLYILDLHGNARKKETTKEGDKDDNVFDIMQGVSINIFVKLPQSLGGYTDFNKSASCHSGHSEEFIKGKSKESNKDVLAMPQHDKQQNNNTQNLATIYHYDLYGKRKDKYNFLLEHNLTSIPWQELKPKDPFYLFIPQNESLREEYDKGWSVKDMFKVSGVGICSKRDNIVFHNSKESLKQMLNDFINKPKEELYRIYDIGEDSRDWRLESAIEAIRENKDNLDDFIMPCHYRPFDYRWTYYISKSRAFMAYPVYDVFKHFLQDSENLGLVCYRTCGAHGLDNVFIANTLIDLHLVGSGSNIFPLYDNTHSENFHTNFRNFINTKYKWSAEDYKENLQIFIAQDDLILNPEAILCYIYAVLFHKDYRKKYIDFLKVDFPKIPFVDSKKKFIALSALGLELMQTHLMQNADLDMSIGNLCQKESKAENKIIEKISYNANTKELFINESLYFDNVDSKVWEYKIGGYQVLDKYLKSHKGEEIDYQHVENIIRTLHKSLEIEAKIAKCEL